MLLGSLGNESYLAEKSVSLWCLLKPCRRQVRTLIHTPWVTWTQMQAMPETACWDNLPTTAPCSPSQRLWQQIDFLTSAEITLSRAKWSFQKSGFLLKKYIHKNSLFIIPGLKPGNRCKTRDALSFPREESKTVANIHSSNFSPVDPAEIHIITFLLRSPNGVDRIIWAGELGRTNFWAESPKLLRNH